MLAFSACQYASKDRYVSGSGREIVRKLTPVPNLCAALET
jgi:hypothetical protein